MIRHRQKEPEQADNGADQALGLAQCQAENRAQGERCQDREGRAAGLPAWSGARLCPPVVNRLIREPNREAPALAQSCVVGGRVGDPVFLSREVVTAVLVQLERQ